MKCESDSKRDFYQLLAHGLIVRRHQSCYHSDLIQLSLTPSSKSKLSTSEEDFVIEWRKMINGLVPNDNTFSAAVKFMSKSINALTHGNLLEYQSFSSLDIIAVHPVSDFRLGFSKLI
jgi:hypothetical protein